MKTQALREVFGETLVELGAQYPNLVVMDGDLANSTKADKFEVAYPERFLEMGIAEQNLMGAAAGLSTLGLIPWISSFAVFLTHRAADPLRMLVAQTHANVKIGAAYAGLLTGYTGKTHQDVEDLAIVRAMPEMVVLAPADAVEARAMMHWATAYIGPVYLRLARDPSPVLFKEDYVFEPGRVIRLKEGADVALVSTGVQTPRTLEAARLLKKEGVHATVLHVGSIKPLNETELVEAVGEAALVVTTEEHNVYGGLGGLVAEVLSAHNPKRVVRIGIQDVFGESAPNEFLLEQHGLSPPKIAQRVLEEVR
ncbi:transketolase family protein [Marinithermus hydrothermalis]|uniref:1-deoxy-D-xylulose-5-phosphate synthase n=1 Tax=Marinithermus hydrothermalis (strain DSM 14884 / JCM 11576 / T1) TaxID=869210 RepID=F2NQG1_MARHT|nr:transketolase C-terminal domain-containing protein [Marinithermus hydrothermalis]AEB11688.1 1-deoxy-D-xylulose-5-phosphate synthase [Marinithermus hydrothermalis DSM 14884]